MNAAFAEMPPGSVSPGPRSHIPFFFAASSQRRGMLYESGPSSSSPGRTGTPGAGRWDVSALLTVATLLLFLLEQILGSPQRVS